MPRIKDIPLGTRFGKLVVVSYAGIGKWYHASWNCTCDCGKSAVVLGSQLRRGTESCGCLFTTAGRRAHNFKDLSGLSFGRWVVSSISEVRVMKNKKKATFWLCRCSCGLEKFVQSAQLAFGTSTRCKKCGSRRLPVGECARRTVLQAYKDEAEDRGYSWTISDTTFDLLTKMSCSYCDSVPSNRRKLPDGSSFIYTGIDRADNTRGYESDNVVPCCRVCNRAKDVMSAEEFIAWANRVANHTRKGNATLPQTNS